MAKRETLRLPGPTSAAEYWIHARQRSVLFLDVMRQRAAQYEEHAGEIAPHVLDYRVELWSTAAGSSVRSTISLSASSRPRTSRSTF